MNETSPKPVSAPPSASINAGPAADQTPPTSPAGKPAHDSTGQKKPAAPDDRFSTAEAVALRKEMLAPFEKAAAEGDLAGYFQALSQLCPRQIRGLRIAKFLRPMTTCVSRNGLAAMTEALFEQMLSFILQLVVRAQHEAMVRIGEADEAHDGGALPADFVNEDLQRIQSLHTYAIRLMESSARVMHTLNTRRRKGDKRVLRFKEQCVELASGPAEAVAAQPVAAQG